MKSHLQLFMTPWISLNQNFNLGLDSLTQDQNFLKRNGDKKEKNDT